MAEKKVRGIPWMTKIDSWYQFSDGLYPGWHPGQSVIHNESKNVQNGSGYVTIENEKWWCDASSTTGAWNVSNLFNSTGVSTHMVNGKRHNSCYFVGGYTSSNNFTNSNSSYYFGEHQSSMVRNAIGFAVQSNCSGSHSTSGGSSQAYLEKVGMFYSDSTRKRWCLIANQKVAGDINLNSEYPDHSNKYYCYRLGSADIAKVKDNNLVLMGMAFQFVHGAKSMGRDSQCNLFNLRILVGDGTGLVNNQSTNRILIADKPDRRLDEYLSNHAMDITADV